MNKLLRFVVTGLLLGWIAYQTDWPAVRQAFAELNVGYWLAAVGLLVATQLVSALRWQIIARQLGMERSFAQLTGYYLIGMYFNLLLPSSVGGDVVRAWYLNNRSGRKLRAVAAVLLDRINGLIVLVAMACVAVLFASSATPTWVPLFIYGVAAAGTLGVIGLACVIKWGRLPANRAQQLQLVWEVAKSPRALATTSLISLVVQVANAVLTWLVGLSLNVDVPLGYYLVLVPLVSLLTLLPISVNGMGVREWGVKLLLVPMGVSPSMAVTLAFLWFAVHLAVSVLGGFVYLFGNFAKPQPAGYEKEVDHGSVDRDSDQGRTRQLDRAA